MKKRYLYNKKNKEQLLEDLKKENLKRITLSFYKYVKLNNLSTLRDDLYEKWYKLGVLGRIYLAQEGINAQISLPEKDKNNFINSLKKFSTFNNIQLKEALDYNQSFLKLTIKIKNEIVAYKIPKSEYNMSKVGKHLNYKEFNDAIDKGATIIDVRNYYEGEVGKFKNAIIPDIDTSRKLLPEIKKFLKGKKDKKVLLYCTGGIRCEKASAYLIHHGFNDINQLDGGIIKYANDIKHSKDESKFIGKNYVFDHRLGERVTDDIISNCHQCDSLCDDHKNCKNQACHILFIQCMKCEKKYNSCCSTKCSNFVKLPIKEQKELFKNGSIKFNAQLSNKIKPKLKEII